MTDSLLTSTIIVREAIRLFASKRHDYIPCEIVGKAVDFSVQLTIPPERLEESIEDFSKHFVSPAMDCLRHIVPHGRFWPMYIAPGNSAAEGYNGVYMRFTLAKDIAISPDWLARFDLLIQPDEWEISG